ncbi:hypothetical protein [Paenibacillus flagellatus]|uniref:Uncharacterized protein n=1 Tax=Paenibacillus flagellatus TaxID=2211139 RepID=A0A2V5KCK0_9BACL|nr:hypothetical protein [Paenibacillus flagellatus]PYI57331.1 hypothetical protein DLM86_02510 [Paenibacillus flagellatus]
MTIFLFLLFSALEWLALIVLTFAMFRFELKGYKWQLLFSSVLLALISYFVFDVLNLRVLATFLQPPIVFIFLWQMFRVQYFYAALMTVYGYLGYLFLQLLLYLIAQSIGVSLDEMIPNTLYAYITQSISVGATGLLAWFLFRYRIGYIFVPFSEYANVIIKGINFRLLVLILIGYAVISFSNYLVFSKGVPVFLLMAMSVILGLLLYLAQKKDDAGDRSIG